jgi:general secretion pathway protein J
MNRPVIRGQRTNAGFTLFEALVAVALMGLIMGALATVTAQWLPNWNRGLLRVQRNEQVAIALDRLVADLSVAEFVSVSANRVNKKPLFEGNELSVTFVRSAVGPNNDPGLEIVRIAETADGRGPILVRARAAFVPLPTVGPPVDRITFSNPVVLLRPPFRTSFAYAGLDGRWTSSWRNSSELPAAVRFVVRDAAARTVSTATRIHVNLMAPEPEQVDEAPAEGAGRGQPGAGETR